MAGADAQMEEESTQPTQQSSQQLQEASQQGHANAHLWGTLIPTSTALTRIDLWRSHQKYTFGRHHSCDYMLRSPKISNVHCTIEWRGGDPGGHPSEVIVTDLSTNGTFINGKPIGKNSHRLLAQGNEISFGSAQDSNPEHDHRYMYRHFGTPKEDHSSDFFDSYQLSVELGTGAFASVRRAVNLKDGQAYAVKIIQQTRFTPSQTKLFEREMEILLSLQHENIVRCFEVFPTSPTIFIVMEMVGGGDMLELIINNNSLDMGLCKSLTRDVCVAMAYLHDLGIVHRDLKPENVLITTGTPCRAKIADFGLAKIIDQDTMLRTQCGTPAYLAPEVILSTHYTSACDCWSVGVMIFCLLTRSAAFDSTNHDVQEADPNMKMMRLREHVMQRRIVWSVTDDIPAEAVSWLRGMLDEDPLTRMTMHNALLHHWLYDPYDSGPSSASFSDIGAGGSGDAHHQNDTNGGSFGGNRNGNGAQPPSNGGASGFGGGGTVRQMSSDFIYGAKMSVAEPSVQAEPENLDPTPAAPVDVSMVFETPRKRRVVSAMDVVNPSPRKRPYPEVNPRRRAVAHV